MLAYLVCDGILEKNSSTGILSASATRRSIAYFLEIDPSSGLFDGASSATRVQQLHDFGSNQVLHTSYDPSTFQVLLRTLRMGISYAERCSDQNGF